MAMRVDKAWQHEFSARIDHVGIISLNTFADLRNRLSVDQYVAVSPLADGFIDGGDVATFDETLPPAAADGWGSILGARAERQQARGRRQALQAGSSFQLHGFPFWPGFPGRSRP